MRLFFKILLILFWCNANLKASSNPDFEEGHIISLKGDMIKGFLLPQESKNASKKCLFKRNADDEYKIYQPGEIAGYRYLDGKYYVSKEINIDSTTKKVVFLEFLIEGMANVYYYVDDEEHYYMENPTHGLLELTEKQKIYNNDGHSYVIPSQYKGKLIFMLQDCPDINNQIQNTRLTHKSLINLTKNYHEKICESCIIYDRDDTSLNVEWGVLMGISKNQYDFGGQLSSNYGNNYQIGATLKLSNIFMFNSHISLKAHLIFEKDSKTYTFSLSDNVRTYNVVYNNVRYVLNNIDYGDAASLPYLPSVTADLNVTGLKIPISLNYGFGITQKTMFTVGIGISNKIIVSQNKNFKVEEFYVRYGKSINSLLTGLTATTGIEGNWFGKNTFFVNVDYEYLQDFRSRSDATLKLLNNQFSLQIGMYF